MAKNNSSCTTSYKVNHRKLAKAVKEGETKLIRFTKDDSVWDFVATINGFNFQLHPFDDEFTLVEGSVKFSNLIKILQCFIILFCELEKLSVIVKNDKE